MTILLTADTLGGVWTYALDVMRALPQHRWILATMGAPLQPDQRAELESLQAQSDITLGESDWALEWMLDPWRSVDQSGRWLLELEAEHAPDIIHLNGYAHAALDFRAPKMAVAHSCVLSWWRAVKGEEAGAEWDEYRHRVRDGLRAADLVAAPTRAMMDEIQALYGPLPQPSERLQVLPNGRAIRPASAVEKIEKEEFCFAAGRLWDEAKNIGLLEGAAPSLNWPIRVAGHGQAGRSGGGLHLMGRVEAGEVLATMRRAAIYVLPARYEPFGLSILEAALCGCALVVGDIPSLREVWGDAALFVAPDDERALADALNRLAADRPWRDEMARRAMERAGHFSLGRLGESYQGAYRMLAEERVSSR